MAARVVPYLSFLTKRVIQERARLNTMSPSMTNPQRTRAVQHVINLQTRLRMQAQIGEWWKEDMDADL